ncbi:MAG TPA: peptidoglycan-associated lipoprotein Pal [Elusimicrobia bacterium]|nr:peptidoglycan-associated lipoprotein Pal [Elusimicrobiota bacterium]
MNKQFLLIWLCYYFLLFAYTGCAKKAIVKQMPSIPAVTIPTPDTEERPSTKWKDYKKIPHLGTVYFDFDSAMLKEEARSILFKNSKWLKNNPEVAIVIEGHCDEKGSTDYNMALGDRRAKSVKSYLMKLGIEEKRIETISYGEEMPVDYGHYESAWAKNRRAESLGKISPEKQEEGKFLPKK